LGRITTILLLAVTLAVTVAAGVSAAQTEDTTDNSCNSSSEGLNSTEARILELHNQARADNGLGPLCVDPILTEAARAHSQDMINQGYFSHTSPDGEDFPDRLRRFGYTSNSVGENIGWGSGSLGEPDVRFEEWMNSSEHRPNILNDNFRDIGIGTSTGTYKGYNNTTMYTVDFGSGQRESESTNNKEQAREAPPTNETNRSESPTTNESPTNDPPPTNETQTNEATKESPTTNEAMSDEEETNALEQANNALEQARQRAEQARQRAQQRAQEAGQLIQDALLADR